MNENVDDIVVGMDYKNSIDDIRFFSSYYTFNYKRHIVNLNNENGCFPLRLRDMDLPYRLKIGSTKYFLCNQHYNDKEVIECDKYFDEMKI